MPPHPSRLWADRAPYAALVLCVLFLFVDLRPWPIQLWDESRIAVNALEMRLSGPSLVTTYGFAPDLWNTKPPLLVWLIAGGMAVLGPSDLAVRLPSMVAAVVTLILVMGFTRRLTGSAWAAALAVVLLAFSLGFFGEHGARTGDYDALLCAFTTAYVMGLFFAVHRRRPSPSWMVAIGALAACALMTKSVAGAVPAAGFLLYLLVTRRWARPFTSPWYMVAAIVALVPPALFYLLREAASPGYLAAVWANDVSGRFLTALDSHAGGAWYYLYVVAAALFFSAGPLALAAPAGLLWTRGKARLGLTFALCAAFGVILVVSLSSTKLPQYLAPAYPFLAISVAIAIHAGLKRLAGAPLLLARALVGLFVVGVVLTGSYLRYDLSAERAFRHQALYGELFARLNAQGHREVSVVDGGVEAVGVPPGYSPQLRFYTLAWRERGLAAERAPSFAAAHAPIIASCDPDVIPALAARGPDLVGQFGCRAMSAATSAR